MTNRQILLTLFLFALALGCGRSDYARMAEKELASGVRKDSLFHGIHFGMTSKDFFTHCWKMNQQGAMWQGPSNTSVETRVEGLRFEGKMNFYPTFFEDRIYEIPMEISYISWSPWNKATSSDSLLKDVQQLIARWYGGELIPIKTPEGKSAWVKVDGNRRVVVYILNESTVKATFTDLLKEPEVKKQKTRAAK